MFRIAEFDNESDRMRKIEELNSIFSSLPGKIKTIKSYEVGTNINSSHHAYDVVINSTFKNMEDLNAYVIHPEHQYAIEKASTIPKVKAVVDYESAQSRKTRIPNQI